MLQHIKIRIKIDVLLDMCESGKNFLSQIFGHLKLNSSMLVTMATKNKLRERNIDYLNFKYN